MRYGIDVATLGGYAEPTRIVEMAQAAEAAGWEALFVWDHLAFVWGVPSADPWVVLAAVAQATNRIRLGTAVTPLARRRPAVVASQVATLDRLSGGRVILGAGLGGVDAEFTALGDDGDAQVRAAKTDEALRVIAALWSGKPVTHRGPHYRVEGVRLAPVPVQRPRVPIWIGGGSRAAHRRAARWDGWIIDCDNEQAEMVRTPGELAQAIADVRSLRGSVDAGSVDAGSVDAGSVDAGSVDAGSVDAGSVDAGSVDAGLIDAGPFDIAMTGVSAGPDDKVFAAYQEAGVTWWLEHLHEGRGSFANLMSRIEAGPPGAPGPPVTGRHGGHR